MLRSSPVSDPTMIADPDAAAAAARAERERARARHRKERRARELAEAKKHGGRRGPREGCCEHFIKGKNRYCGIKRLAGEKFCVNHGGVKASEQRTPCPIDPTHSVYVDQLQKHLKKCVSSKNVNQWTSKPYYAAGIHNRPASDHHATQTPRKLADYSAEERGDMIGRLDEIEEAMLAQTKPQDGVLDALAQQKRSAPLPDAANAQSHNGAKLPPFMRHRAQEDVIIRSTRALLARGGPAPEQVCLLDMGAGKGALSLHAQEHFGDVGELSHVLVDRRSFTSKRDPHIAARAHGFERIRMDLRDLDLWKVPTVAEARARGAQIALFAKHLCGVATCYSLRGAASPQASDDDQAVDAIVIALCCHGACSWDGFLNRPALERLGLGRHEFDLIRSMAAWAVDHNARQPGEARVANNNGDDGPVEDEEEEEDDDDDDDGDSDDGDDGDQAEVNVEDCARAAKMARISHNAEDLPAARTANISHDAQDPSVEARHRIGLQCKNILNLARVQFLQAQGYDAALHTFVDAGTTKENTLLVALRPHPKAPASDRCGSSSTLRT